MRPCQISPLKQPTMQLGNAFWLGSALGNALPWVDAMVMNKVSAPAEAACQLCDILKSGAHCYNIHRWLAIFCRP